MTRYRSDPNSSELDDAASLRDQLMAARDLAADLQEERDKLKHRVAELERERDELRRQRRKRFLAANDLEIERNLVQRQAAAIAEERAVFESVKAQFEQEREAFQRRETDLNAEISQLRGQLAQQNAAAPAPSPYAYKSALLRLRDLRDSVRMAPGSFALLNEEGDESGYTGALLNDSIESYEYARSPLGFVQKGVHDPSTDRVLVCGARYTGGFPANELRRYDAATNTWTSQPMPAAWTAGRPFDAVAVNLGAREFYLSPPLRGNGLIGRMNLDTGVWTSINQPSSMGFRSSGASAEYFPDRNELVWLQTRRLSVWHPSTNKWTVTPMVLSALGWRSAIARYNPVARCMILMGGGGDDAKSATFAHGVYRYDAKGAVTRMKDAPLELRIYINHAVAAVDPVTGELIVLQSHEGRAGLWKYDVNADVWNELDANIVPPASEWRAGSDMFGVVAIPVSRYGVILFLSGAGANSKVYVYKHG